MIELNQMEFMHMGCKSFYTGLRIVDDLRSYNQPVGRE